MKLEGSWFTESAGGASPDPDYKAFASSEALDPMKSYVIDVIGLPEGRGREWIMGGSVGVLLLLCAIALGIKTRPKIVGGTLNDGESVLVG